MGIRVKLNVKLDTADCSTGVPVDCHCKSIQKFWHVKKL